MSISCFGGPQIQLLNSHYVCTYSQDIAESVFISGILKELQNCVFQYIQKQMAFPRKCTEKIT
jgi:hypothetical protein